MAKARVSGYMEIETVTIQKRKEIDLQLTEDEAEALLAVLGRVGGDGNRKHGRQFLSRISDALHKLGIDDEKYNSYIVNTMTIKN